ncbi:MAG: hypothetical protein D9V47_14010 [Clostridia bacterium]|nr:MAG: hypothetical protein D9V47_14010 [Clostridia bacterium]
MPEEARQESAAAQDEAGVTSGFHLIPYLLQRLDHLELHLRQEIQQGDAALRQEIQQGDAALRQEISGLRQEMQQGNAALRQEISNLRLWMIGTLITVIVTFVTVLFRGF